MAKKWVEKVCPTCEGEKQVEIMHHGDGCYVLTCGDPEQLWPERTCGGTGVIEVEVDENEDRIIIGDLTLDNINAYLR
jgi:hypothetical protein